MKKIKVFFSTVLPVLAAFLSFWVWNAMYQGTVMQFKGIGLHQNEKATYIKLASFCGDEIVMCSRPLTFWILLGFEKVVAIFLQLFASIISPTTIVLSKLSPVTISSITATCVLGLFYMASFYFLWKAFPGVYGFLAWASFLSIPLVTHIIGLAWYDATTLCFWSLVLWVSIRILPEYFDESIGGWKNWRGALQREQIRSCLNWKNLSKYGFIIGLMASFIMQNVGVAFCVGSLFLLIIGRFLGYKIPTFGFVFSSGLGILLAFGISWVMTHRHDDVTWLIHPDDSVGVLYDIYGRFNTYGSIKRLVVYMMMPAVKIGTLIFFLSIVFGDFIGKVDLKQIIRTLIISTSFFLGFLSTVMVGRFTAGYKDEFARQLLPVSYFSSYIFPALGLLAGFWMRKLIVLRLNVLLSRSGYKKSDEYDHS